MAEVIDTITRDLSACRLCAARFAATATAHEPRPVVWIGGAARILVAGQAPGVRVYESGKPFDDASGARLRDWMGLSDEEFWDRDRVAFLPMGFCFPGYNAHGHDLPPPPICAATWRAPLMAALPGIRLNVLIGAYAQRWHLGAAATAGGVSATVARWREFGPATFPLPHPSWRNTAWLKRNPWFAEDLLPALKDRVRACMDDDGPDRA